MRPISNGIERLRNAGGGLGDVYIIDSAGDVVTELANEGYDTITSSVSYVLAQGGNVEARRLTGSANTNATGNSSANFLQGNPGDNILDGGGGGDRLVGGLGDDTNIIRASNHRIIEVVGGGSNDVVKSAVSYALTSVTWVETLMPVI